VCISPDRLGVIVGSLELLLAIFGRRCHKVSNRGKHARVLGWKVAATSVQKGTGTKSPTLPIYWITYTLSTFSVKLSISVQSQIVVGLLSLVRTRMLSSIVDLSTPLALNLESVSRQRSSRQANNKVATWPFGMRCIISSDFTCSSLILRFI